MHSPGKVFIVNIIYKKMYFHCLLLPEMQSDFAISKKKNVSKNVHILPKYIVPTSNITFHKVQTEQLLSEMS